jgi:hypothetical protein
MWHRILATVALTAALFVAQPGLSQAATTYTDSVSGVEVAATSTKGTFVGTASGDLPGYWKAIVYHTPLSPSATVTGGSIYLASYFGVRGDVSGGSVTFLSGTGCSNQYYDVHLDLSNVHGGGKTGGTGTFDGTLVHKRTLLFGQCVTYGATVSGTLVVSL